MNKNKKEELENQIEKLEKIKINYLEVDNNAGARRVSKKIEHVQLQIELIELTNLKQELAIYKKVISNYPNLLQEVNNQLSERKKRT